MRRLAVIGATGFLGNHTIRAVVEAGYEAVAVYRDRSLSRRLETLDAQSIIASLDDREGLVAALSGVDAAIHCAAYQPSVLQPREAELARAAEQMQTFCQACVASGCPKVVYVGAASTLQHSRSGQPADERQLRVAAPADRNLFVQVKWLMERIALDYIRAGLPLVIGIPSMAFGEYDYGPTAGRLIVGIANRTLPAYVGGRRNVIYAGDVARALVLCATRGQVGERYLLVGENTTMTNLIRVIARLAGTTPPRRIPLPVAHAVAGMQLLRYRLGGRSPFITSTTLKVLAGGQFLDGGKAARELGFIPLVGIDAAVERALTWFRVNDYI